MKLPLKIFLLLLFTVAAVGGVLLFIKTRLSPPADIEFHDPYAKPLTKDVARVNSSLYPLNRDAYVKAYHKVKFMNGEGLLADGEADGLVRDINDDYAQSIVEYAYGVFNGSEWPDSTLTAIRKAFGPLRDDYLSDGSPALSGSKSNAMSDIDKIIDSYYEALKFAADTKYRKKDAQQRIARIGSYREKPFLSNNAGLMKRLDKMPEEIAKSHHGYVSGQIDRLAAYKRLKNRDDFNKMVFEINDVMDDYRRASYPGVPKSTESLERKLQEYLTAANSHFTKIEEEERLNHIQYEY